jgi:hypothetical protein
MVAISLNVEGVVCEEQEVRGLNAIVLKPWGPKNIRTSSRTPASAHVPVVTFPSPSSCLKESGEKRAKK